MIKNLRLLYFLFLSIIILSNIILAQDWHSIGPSAQPFSICVSSEYILLGTLESGVIKSTDNGVSWKYVKGMPPKAYGILPSNAITCIQYDPTNIQIVYAGTGLDETSTGHGFYKSTDRGETWQAKSSGLPQWSAVREISINPFHTNEIFILCKYNGGPGIFRSTDYGESWGLFYKDTYLNSTLIFNFADSSLQYATGVDGNINQWLNGNYSRLSSLTNFFSTGFPVRTFLNPKTRSIFYIHNTNIYKWDNNGNWASLLNNLQTNGIKINSISDANIDERSGTIFISTNYGVFKSVDDGERWKLTESCDNMKIGVDNGKIVLAGFKGLYVSNDNETQFTRTAEGPKISTIYSISVIHSALGNTIYSIDYNSVFKSTDEGLSWIKLQLPNGASPTVIEANPLNPDIVYVGCGAFYTANLGLYKSYDGGMNWKQILADSKIPVTAIEIPSSDTSRILLGCPGVIYESTNSGNTWNTILTIDDNASEIWTVKISEINPERIFIGTSSNDTYKCGVFVTTNNGYYWEKRVNGLPEGLSYTAIRSLAVHPQNDSIIFIGNSSSVYKSTNMGLLWEKCGFPDFTETGYINDIQFAKEDTNLILVTVRGRRIGEGGLFRSSDGGDNWQEITFPDVSDKSRTSLIILPSNNKFRIYVGTISYGIYVGEITKTLSSVLSNRLMGKSYILYQNYPNPFNSETIINYQLPISCLVNLKIFDLLGHQIETLVDQNQSAGNHKILWNAGLLSSGVYFYRLQAGSFFETKKLLLMK